MTVAWCFFDYDPAGQGKGYINATSTCDCAFRAGFAGQSVRVPTDARVKNSPEQRLNA